MSEAVPRGPFRPLLISALAGGTAALGLEPYGLWPLALLGYMVLGGLIARHSSRVSAAWICWIFAAAFFAHTLVWLVEPFLVDARRHAWLIPFALTGMAGGLALFWLAAGWLGGGHVWLTALLLALAETVRGYVLTGFPWAGPAQIWVGTALAQSLAWIGPYGLGAMTLLAALPPGCVLAQWHPRKAALAGIPGMTLALGALLPMPDTDSSGRVVRLVQPNAPQHQRWDPDYIPVFLQRQLDYSAREPRPDLVVWSETAVPYLLNDSSGILAAMANAAGTPVLAGIQREENGHFHNSAVLVGVDGSVRAIYDKYRLVPFGEYMPAAPLVSRLGIHGLAARAEGGYSPGPGPRLLELPGIGTALPLICYEGVFPHGLRGTARPDLLALLTNDAWFGTYAGPYQHLAQARMRAIEQGLPMIRVANTGVSAMIDPAGQITAQIPLASAGYVDAPLPVALPPTLYARTGDLPAILLIALASFALALSRWRNFD